MTFRYTLELILLSVIWGSSFMFLRVAAPEFGAVPLIAIRVLVAGLVLLFPLYLSGQWKVVLVHWRHILISGLLSSALPFSLIAYSSMHATSGYVSLLNATVPIWSIFVVYFWLGEKPSFQAMLGVAIGFVGVFVLYQDDVSLGSDVGFWAVAAGLAATFFYALATSHRKQYSKSSSPLVITAGGQIFSAIALLPLALIFWPEQSPSAKAWGSAVILGVLCTAVAFLMFFRLLKNIGIANTVSVAYLIPVSAVLLGFIVLGEAITPNMILGGFLVLLGVGFTTGLFGFRQKRID